MRPRRPDAAASLADERLAAAETRLAVLEAAVLDRGGMVHDLAGKVARMLSPLWMDGSPFSTWDEPGVGPVLGYQAGAAPEGFAPVFRGSEERVRGLLEPYVPLLAGAGPVADLGCGRGELLELLVAEGTAVHGVEADRALVEHCRRRRLPVEHADAVEWLERRSPASLGAIVAIEVVEHLTLDRLLHLLALARTRLRPGGTLVAETVNIHEPAAAKGFWIDPTHVRPLFPEVLLMLCAEAGFARAHLFFPGGSGDPAVDIATHPTYAVVASVAPVAP